MQHYLASLTLLLLVALVIFRVSHMRRHGVDAMLFGKLDKKDLLIPPFALFYFYQVFARTFELPGVSNQQFFKSVPISWFGILLCLGGLILFLFSITSFGSSFRVGIDVDNPDKLVTTGVFAITRNPIYVAFWIVLLGQFLVFPNRILLLYLGGATWLFHRQVLLEEAFLEEHYGQEYSEYCARVRRYV
jgi:protein-S-isoprenylcysteine O-methyltransferase Ste14